MEAAVGLTEDMGMQKVLPIPEDNAGFTRPYPYQWLPLALFFMTRRTKLVLHGKDVA